jgi:hypothetical protein
MKTTGEVLESSSEDGANDDEIEHTPCDIAAGRNENLMRYLQVVPHRWAVLSPGAEIGKKKEREELREKRSKKKQTQSN